MKDTVEKISQEVEQKDQGIELGEKDNKNGEQTSAGVLVPNTRSSGKTAVKTGREKLGEMSQDSCQGHELGDDRSPLSPPCNGCKQTQSVNITIKL